MRLTKETIRRADAYAYEGRKQKKRNFRKLWITRINAAVRNQGMTYSTFMHGLKMADISVNRKHLSEMAIHDPDSFNYLVEQSKEALNDK